MHRQKQTNKQKTTQAKEKAQETHVDTETHTFTYIECLKNPKLETIIYEQNTCKVKKKYCSD